MAVEINTSFYRLHSPQTYARWSALTPPQFRFAVKLPRQITHFSALHDRETLHRFYESTLGLGEKLGVWLIQLPPRLEWEEQSVARFFEAVRHLYEGRLVCEPRHPSWFTDAAESLMETWQVTRAIANPAPHPRGQQLLPWSDTVYYRLHGSPQRYISAYSSEFLSHLAGEVRSYLGSKQVWVIFNNTARGAALINALEIQRLLERGEREFV